MEGYKPAKKSVALTALLVSALLLIAFVLVLRADIRGAKALNPAGWEEPTPAGFACGFTAEAENGALTLRGWACVEGERILTVENYAVLYDRVNGSYLRLPTVMEYDEAPNTALGGDILYDRAGFVSITPLKYLSQAPGAYELCFAYGSNGHKALVHTGVTLAEGGAAW